jgi:hypothetical protein
VETSEPEILIPAPTGYTNVVACFHRRHADDAPDNDNIKLMEQDGMKLFLTKLEDFGEYMMDIYEKDDKGVLKQLARYQINRKPASELYKDDAKMLMEQLLQGAGIRISGSDVSTVSMITLGSSISLLISSAFSSLIPCPSDCIR